jgi:hypothetical protein
LFALTHWSHISRFFHPQQNQHRRNPLINRHIGRASLIALVLTAVCFQGVGANPYASHYADGAGGWRSNCTWWAWQRWYEVNGEALPSWGNAGEWAANAQAAGYAVDGTPSAGSIVLTWESPLGHVAFVETVDANDPNSFLISEFGYAAGVDYHERWITTDGSLIFIHPRAEQTASNREQESQDGDGTGGP